MAIGWKCGWWDVAELDQEVTGSGEHERVLIVGCFGVCIDGVGWDGTVKQGKCRLGKSLNLRKVCLNFVIGCYLTLYSVLGSPVFGYLGAHSNGLA